MEYNWIDEKEKGMQQQRRCKIRVSTIHAITTVA